MKTEQIVLISAIVVITIAIFGFVSQSGTTNFDYGNYGYGMMGNFFMGFGFMWMFGFLFMTLIIIALVLFIIWMAKQINKQK
ncbi:MAG TPA: hypothetical protein VI544_02810 [Candidatus Nanoarchaeia archaeon]|nr:hypothetical protein [Candidatus Nanoarchaeia archaeon]